MQIASIGHWSVNKNHLPVICFTTENLRNWKPRIRHFLENFLILRKHHNPYQATDKPVPGIIYNVNQEDNGEINNVP